MSTPIAMPATEAFGTTSPAVIVDRVTELQPPATHRVPYVWRAPPLAPETLTCVTTIGAAPATMPVHTEPASHPRAAPSRPLHHWIRLQRAR